MVQVDSIGLVILAERLRSGERNAHSFFCLPYKLKEYFYVSRSAAFAANAKPIRFNTAAPRAPQNIVNQCFNIFTLLRI